MPTLHVHVTGKPTRPIRRTLVQRLTDAVCLSVDKRPDDVTIYLYTHGEIARDRLRRRTLLRQALEAAATTTACPRQDNEEVRDDYSTADSGWQQSWHSIVLSLMGGPGDSISAANLRQ